MNGEFVYLSGCELAVWFKKRGAKVFNARCKNTVFKHPNGSSKLFPCEKNHELLAELITDNTNVGDTVFDPCAGSGSHLLMALRGGAKRRWRRNQRRIPQVSNGKTGGGIWEITIDL